LGKKYFFTKLKKFNKYRGEIIKILIIGIVASGKTTLAKRLSKENNIKYYEIDSIVHDNQNKRKRTNKEQQEIIKKINKSNNWIIEGTLRKNLYNLLDETSKIIYLDIPLKVRKRRILLRFLKQKIALEKCNYKPTLKMLKMMYLWTKDFENNKIDIEKKLIKYKEKLIKLNAIDKIKNYKL